MILFINTFITNDNWGKYDRGLYPQENNLDVFLYSLCSLSVIPWSKVIIYCQLDTPFLDRKEELNNVINECFGSKAKVYDFRNGYVSQWQTAMNEIFPTNNEPIWFSCNHDHIFLDYNLELLQIIEEAIKNHDSPYVSCYLSHFPEQHRTFPTCMKYKTEHYICSSAGCSDGIQIVTEDLLRYWWFEVERDPNTFYRRSDCTNPTGDTVVIRRHDILLPFRELCRHFDAYRRHETENLNHCPPLFIPEGFFEKKMKISYCGDTPKPGYISVNPLLKETTATSATGADLRCMLEDLPLFWRDRIETIERGQKIDRDALVLARNEAYWEFANADSCGLSYGLNISDKECFNYMFR